jgi:hypothetical protein
MTFVFIIMIKYLYEIIKGESPDFLIIYLEKKNEMFINNNII